MCVGGGDRGRGDRSGSVDSWRDPATPGCFPPPTIIAVPFMAPNAWLSVPVEGGQMLTHAAFLRRRHECVTCRKQPCLVCVYSRVRCVCVCDVYMSLAWMERVRRRLLGAANTSGSHVCGGPWFWWSRGWGERCRLSRGSDSDQLNKNNRSCFTAAGSDARRVYLCVNPIAEKLME